MTSRVLFLLVVTLFVSIVLVAYYKMRQPLHNIQPISSLPSKPQKIGEEYARYLITLNEKNKQIKSLTTNNLRAYIWHNAIRIKLDGSLSYQKNLNFRMQLNSVVSNEFDMGSNPQEFWFWSKRLKPCALYYAKQEDIFKARLKPLFNPVNIMKSLGFDEIQIDSITGVTQQGDNLVFVEKVQDAQGNWVFKLTFINKDTNLLVGYMISDADGKCLASTEILDYKDGFPQQIMFTWSEENQVLLLDLGSYCTNAIINQETWQRPDIKPAVDMGKENVSFTYSELSE